MSVSDTAPNEASEASASALKSTTFARMPSEFESQLQLALALALPTHGIAHAVLGLHDVCERHGTGRGIEGLRLCLEFDDRLHQNAVGM